MKLRKIFAAVVLFLSAGTAMAQQMPAIPVDKNVKIGHLDNGLTYYIRHNSYPEHVASFYIAQKVGSINENDDQRGLRSEEHTSELQSRFDLVCRLLLEKKKKKKKRREH